MNYRQRKYEQGKAARDDIYMFLVKYFEQHGYAPSYEEIGGRNWAYKMYSPTPYAAIRDGFFDCHRTSWNITCIPLDRISVRKAEKWEVN